MEPPRKTKRGPYGKRDLEKQVSKHDCAVDLADDDDLDIEESDLNRHKYIDLNDDEAVTFVESDSLDETKPVYCCVEQSASNVRHGFFFYFFVFVFDFFSLRDRKHFVTSGFIFSVTSRKISAIRVTVIQANAQLQQRLTLILANAQLYLRLVTLENSH